MRKRIEWTPAARADVQRIDRHIALSLLEDLADYVLTGYGDVERLTDVNPLELPSAWVTTASASTNHGEWLQILRVLHRRDAYR